MRLRPVFKLWPIFVLIVLTSCATSQGIEWPEYNAPEFSQSGTTELPDRWWHSFNSQPLNNHIQYALDNNFSLAAAWKRVEAARAITQRQASALYPDVNLEGAANRTIDDGREQDRFEVGPTVSYEVDLWGRIRSQAQAERLQAEATEEEYRTAGLTLSADTALTWIRLIEAYEQLQLLQNQMKTNEKALEVLKARFGVGLIRSEDILRQQLSIEAVEDSILLVQNDKQIFENQLAVLRGEPPQGANFKTSETLPHLPPLPDTGLPADLIKRRPDVRQAYYQLAAADATLAAAIRDQYPSLNLSASYVTEAASAGGLFSDWVTSIAASIIAPVFDGGLRQAEVSRAEARKAELLNLYKQTVLEAFQEVEDALVQEETQQKRITNLKSRLDIAKTTYDQIQLGYFNGANEFLSLLTAQNELQQIERDLLTAQRNLIEYRITLYRALAGGFTTQRENNMDEDI